MKKFTVILFTAMVLVTSWTGIASASDVGVYVDGKKLLFDAQPTIENGTTQVPIEPVFAALGAKFTWDQEQKIIKFSRAGNNISLKMGDPTALINEKPIPVKLDVPLKTVEGKILVPLRFVSVALGATIKWDGQNSRIDITGGNENVSPFEKGILGVTLGDSFSKVIDKLGLPVVESSYKDKISIQYEGLSFWSDISDEKRRVKSIIVSSKDVGTGEDRIKIGDNYNQVKDFLNQGAYVFKKEGNTVDYYYPPLNLRVWLENDTIRQITIFA